MKIIIIENNANKTAGQNNVACFSDVTLEHHKQVISEMINRDKNHPSILMWSLANEPLSSSKEANVYYSTLFNFTRPIAARRPVTFVTYGIADTDQERGAYEKRFCHFRQDQE